jgi:hypothetical protein
MQRRSAGVIFAQHSENVRIGDRIAPAADDGKQHRESVDSGMSRIAAAPACAANTDEGLTTVTWMRGSHG